MQRSRIGIKSFESVCGEENRFLARDIVYYFTSRLFRCSCIMRWSPDDWLGTSCVWSYAACQAPLSSYEDWKSGASDRNARILNRIKSSGDDELDKMAFEKTMDETSAGVLLGPFSCLSQLASPDPGLAPRCGIWEQHGVAEDPGVRNIDDLLYGEQNETAGCLMSHRPTDADALVA